MNNSEIYKRLYKDYSKKYINKILISVFFGVLVAASTSAIAWLLDPAIKKIFVEKDQSLIFIIPLLIIIAFTIKGFALYFAKAIMIKVAEEIKKILQSQMVKSLINADTQLIDKKHSGKFISNLTYDVSHITNLLSDAILVFSKDSLTLIGLLVVMFYQNWKLSILAIIMIPLAAYFSKIIGNRMGKIVKGSLQASEVFTKYLSEILKSTSVIKIFQQENKELDNFKKIIEDRIEKMTKVERTRFAAAPIMETITGFAVAIVVFAGGYLSIENKIELGSFFSFLTALILAYQPVKALSGVNLGINEGLAAVKRIYALLDNKDIIVNNPNKQNLKITNKDIVFENVSFSYPDGTLAVKNFSTTIKGGQTIALVGKSGSGKSSIINLLPRFYDYSEGKILIDNQEIKQVSLTSLRKEIAMVSQDIILFDDTVRANIMYGKINASENEFIEASKNASADEFIQNLSNGYDTVIGENGVKISGGQKQRISIARAILKNSSIILLDEATSALDNESELKVKNAIDNLIKDRTTIVVAHRLSTIKNANKIIVMSDGCIEDEGTHDELLTKSKTYKKLYDQELNNQEHA